MKRTNHLVNLLTNRGMSKEDANRYMETASDNFEDILQSDSLDDAEDFLEETFGVGLEAFMDMIDFMKENDDE